MTVQESGVTPVAPADEPVPLITPVLGEHEIAAVSDVIRSGWVAQGPRVAEFEVRFAAKVGAAHGVAVSSCTAGLHLALLLAGVEAGDEVIVPSLSFIATANAPVYVGATPVYADVDPTTGNITAATISAVLTERTSAVLLVHQAGVPADLEAIAGLCSERGVKLVEDAACAVGSTYGGTPIGGHGNPAVFSFHPRKLLTTGEGGMIVLDDADLAVRARRLREHGMNISAAERHGRSSTTFEAYTELGFNYRMTDIQAAVGLVQLDRLDEIIERRRALAAHYQRNLADVPNVRPVTDPSNGTGNFQSFWVVLADGARIDRDELMKELESQSIASRRGIMAAHMEPAGSRWKRGPLPETEHLTNRSVILPLAHGMTESTVERVCDVIRAAV